MKSHFLRFGGTVVVKLVVSFLLVFTGIILKVLPSEAQEKEMTENEMTTYYMAFLYRGPAWTPEVTKETEEIQAGHMSHINMMAESGVLILAGPFLDGGDLRGIFVFNVPTQKEAEMLVKDDPAVRAGRLRVELKPWYSAKGISIVPPKKTASKPE